MAGDGFNPQIIDNGDGTVTIPPVTYGQYAIEARSPHGGFGLPFLSQTFRHPLPDGEHPQIGERPYAVNRSDGNKYMSNVTRMRTAHAFPKPTCLATSGPFVELIMSGFSKGVIAQRACVIRTIRNPWTGLIDHFDEYGLRTHSTH